MINSLFSRIILIISLLAVILLFAEEVPQKTVSNEEIAYDMMITPVLMQSYNYVADSSNLAFSIVESASDLSVWMKQNLIDSCIAHGYPVYENVNNLSGSFVLIEITQADISFKYKSAGKKWLFFNSGYKRIVNSNFHISIRSNTGKIIFSENISDSFVDTVSNIKVIENGKLAFTKGEKLSTSIAKKLIEPVLITASALTVVYLFYSLRSGN